MKITLKLSFGKRPMLQHPNFFKTLSSRDQINLFPKLMVVFDIPMIMTLTLCLRRRPNLLESIVITKFGYTQIVTSLGHF